MTGKKDIMESPLKRPNKKDLNEQTTKITN